MQTVSRETATLLKEAGWVKETSWIYIFDYHESGVEKFWELYLRDYSAMELVDWIPAPTLDELLEEITFDDFKDYFTEHVWQDMAWSDFPKWLYTTMRSVEECAKVWAEMHGVK